MERDKLVELIANSDIVKIVMSETKNEIKKISITKMLIKNEIYYQLEYIQDKKAYHKNLKKFEMNEYVEKSLDGYNQILVKTSSSNYHIHLKKGKYVMKVTDSESDFKIKEHNIKKTYFLNEGDDIAFLKELGIMNEDNKVFKKKYAKFRQINKYLEIIDETIQELIDKKYITDSIKMLDFGSGKSYLTFATYYYLTKYRKELDFKLVGLDLKKDVIQNCSKLAKKLSYSKMEFLNKDIRDYVDNGCDLVFSLHACNNATDYAIKKALELNSKAILLVPCCHNEFYKKIQIKEELSFLNKDKIVKEKYASLVTDSYRKAFLEMCGYTTQISEFTKMKDTPKNILIKSILGNRKKDVSKNFENLEKSIGFKPVLYDIASEYIKFKK